MFEDELNELIDNAKKEMLLIEMADIMSSDQQYGFLVTVFSNDHNPPHAHVRTLEGKTIGQFLITENPPKNIEDLQLYNTESLDRKIKKNIVEWANKNVPNKNYTYWEKLKDYWETFQSSNYQNE